MMASRNEAARSGGTFDLIRKIKNALIVANAMLDLTTFFHSTKSLTVSKERENQVNYFRSTKEHSILL